MFESTQIWTPGADRCLHCGRRRRRAFSPLSRAAKFAAGDVMLDSSGNIILDSSGNVMLDDGAGNACCCDNYIRAKSCCDNRYLDLWKSTSGLTLPYYFKVGNVCGYFASGNTTSSTPGTLLSGETTITGCCAYIQATKCLDGSTVDLWRAVASGVPYYFSKSGVCYKIECGNPMSDSPGTMLSGETSKSSCEACWACGGCATTPLQFTLTFSGVSLCTCFNLGNGTSLKANGTLNGTFCLTRTSDSSCIWKFIDHTWSGVTVDLYSASGSCSGAFTRTVGIELTIFIGGAGLAVSALHGMYRQSDGFGPITSQPTSFLYNSLLPDCASFTVSNSLTCPSSLMSGGTATGTSGC